MVIGIGCDIVEHAITETLQWQSDKSVQGRIFSPGELSLYDSSKAIKFLAGRFAAKEAVLKCVGLGMQDGISLTDIQITSDYAGKPIIELSGHIKKVADEMGIGSWHITITHSSTCSIAFVIAES
ncbi:MAG TPA: holo-ACP synthase [Flavisolibacter sp.]|jgi:holo-[acyl-carrier protein] synthase|nr:holo-ACP synthase [Flavisolibacter sp.]